MFLLETVVIYPVLSAVTFPDLCWPVVGILDHNYGHSLTHVILTLCLLTCDIGTCTANSTFNFCNINMDEKCADIKKTIVILSNLYDQLKETLTNFQ